MSYFSPIIRASNSYSSSKKRQLLLNTSYYFGTRKDQQNPFRTLGLSDPNCDFATVKRAFVKLALQKHPDQNNGDGAASLEEFIQIREAYNLIRERRLGQQKQHPGDFDVWNDDDIPSADWNPAELQEWFRKETGDYLTFEMSETTRKEVIDVYEKMPRPLNDKGGYWEMARLLSERERHKSGSSNRDDDEPPLQLSQPQASSTTANPSLSSRRRRKR